MSVTNLHPLYEKRSRQWRVIRDCVEGEDAIKSAGEAYLPRACGVSDARYKAYMQRARWNNYLAQNLDGLHGLIFRRDPVVTEKNDEFLKSKMLENIDRKGTSLYQFASDTIYDAMQTSFGGYLVDLPAVQRAVNLEEKEKLGIRPYLRYYPAESIINWGYINKDGIEKLAYVVLQEEVENTKSDEFSHNPTVQYRVLDIRDGYYVQRIFNKLEEAKDGEVSYGESVNPIVINGKTINYIPFFTLPGDKPEKPMFYDLAMCNIGHYQKTADYENGVHLTTIPTGYVTGHRQVEYDDGSKEIVNLGADSFLMFEEPEAKVGTLVFSGAGLTHSETAIDKALTDMAILGSRLLVTEKGTSESADSAKIHRAGENARLATFAKNASEVLTKAIRTMAEWEGLDTSIRVELCTDYDILQFDANVMNAIANLSRDGNMPIPALFKNLKDGEFLPQEMTLDIFATMITLPSLNYSPIEQAKIYKTLVSGENVELIEKPQETFNNAPKEDPEDTQKDDVIEE